MCRLSSQTGKKRIHAPLLNTCCKFDKNTARCVKLLIHAVFRYINEMCRRLMRLAPANSHIKPRRAGPRCKPITARLATIGSLHPCSPFNSISPYQKTKRLINQQCNFSRVFLSWSSHWMSNRSPIICFLAADISIKTDILHQGKFTRKAIIMILERIVYFKTPSHVWKHL